MLDRGAVTWIARVRDMAKHRHVIVAAARWETDSIVEWLNFYRHIGFDHIYLYCNDDRPDELYEAVMPFVVGPRPFVTFNYYSLTGMQEQMYTHFLRNHIYDCEWFAFIDIDEFVLLRDYDSIGEFLASFDERPDAIAFHSVNAGHCGHKERPSGSVIANYTRRSDQVEAFTKNIARSDAFSYEQLNRHHGGAWWHNVEAILKPHAKYVNVLGESMKGFYLDHAKNWQATYSPQFVRSVLDTAFLFHVGMKSESDLIRRVQRGLAGDFSTQKHWRELHEQGEAGIQAFFAPRNAVEETRLLEIREAMLRRSFRNVVIPPVEGFNLALGKPATQSSTSVHSAHRNPEDDAAGVVDGRLNGKYSHCTEFEDAPWWQVDLEQPTEIRQVRLFNRMDIAKDRLRNVVGCVSLDGSHWIEIFRKEDNMPFGGVDGRMFIWKTGQPIITRYLRITGIGPCFLDLDQVEVY